VAALGFVGLNLLIHARVNILHQIYTYASRVSHIFQYFANLFCTGAFLESPFLAKGGRFAPPARTGGFFF